MWLCATVRRVTKSIYMMFCCLVGTILQEEARPSVAAIDAESTSVSSTKSQVEIDLPIDPSGNALARSSIAFRSLNLRG